MTTLELKMVNRAKHKLGFTLIVLTLILILGSSVLASIEVVSDDLTIAVNYENLDSDEEVLDISHQITIKNTGNATEALSFSLEGLSAGYDLTVTPASLNLSPLTESTITISGTIPVNADQGVKNIGTLKITGASQGDITQTLKTDVQSMLNLKRIEVYVNGQKIKTVTDDGEKVKELKPGDEVELKFVLENLFDEDYDEGDISGEVSIELYDSDFGDDIDTSEEFKVSAGDEIGGEEITLAFTVPLDAEDDNYNLEIKVNGEDGNDAEYTTEWDMAVEVERNKNDLRIETAELTPAEVSCSRNAELSAEIANYGSNVQKHAVLSMVNLELGLDEKIEFVLQEGTDKDNTAVKSIPVSLDADVPAGTYPIVVSVFYDYNSLSDKVTVDLVVKNCAVKQETQGTEVTGQQEEPEETAEEADLITSSNVVKTVEKKPLTTEDYLVGLIIVAIVAIFVLIALLLVALIRKD